MRAPEIGTPPGSINRPVIVSLRPNTVVRLTLAVLRQRAVRTAEEVAPVPFGVPATPAPPGRSEAVGAAGTTIVRSSTGAELPAASSTVTIRGCAPGLRRDVSKPTSALTEDGHGCKCRHARSPPV